MTDDAWRSIGTLGSELTFAGQATLALQQGQVGVPQPEYFPTMDAVVEAVLDGRIEVGVLTSETSRTACTDTAARILAGDPLFIVDEVVVPYHCALLVKPGTRLEEIRHVGGHGSLRQCSEFLRTRLPQATSQMHALNSVEAAREVLAGDGTSAVVGTLALAADVGLEVLARDVDGGAAGGWWGLSARAAFPRGGDHVAVRVDGSAALGQVLEELAAHDLSVRTITNQPSGQIFEYRYLITARGRTGEPVSDAAVEALGSRLIGLFSSTTVN